ncbi:MAG: aldo/keto reductase [Bacteriovoracaceae bacterium]
MKTCEFKPLKIKLSQICFGGAALSGEGGGYGFGTLSEKEAEYILIQSFEKGINFFDTAPIYGFGLSEIRIGKYLKQVRDKIVVISKSGINWHESKRVDRTNSREVTEKMLGESLNRLNFDYIDCYMIHWPDPRTDIRIPMEVLSKAKQAGKIRSIGLCNTNIEDLQKALEIDTVDLVQSEVNFFKNAIKGELQDLLQKNSISAMGWGTFDKGILLDKVTKERKYEKCDARSSAPWWKQQDLDKKLTIVKKLKQELQNTNHNLIEFNLGYNFLEANLLACAIGYKNLEQLESILLALDNLPQNETITRIKNHVNS